MRATATVKAKISSDADPFAKFEGNRDFVASLARGLEVIKAFNNEPQGMSAANIARKTGLSRAAVRRFLLTLELLDYVEKNNGQFRLRPAVLRIGSVFLSSTSVPVLAQPILEAVSSKLQQSTSLSMLDGDDIIYLARHTSSRVLSVGLSVGSRLPAYCTSMGRVLLANLPAEQLNGYLSRAKLRRWTSRTVIARSKLAGILKQVAEQGYALVDGELEPGLRSIAVPIRNSSGRVVAAMNVGIHISTATPDEMLRRYLPVLNSNAEILSRLL
jgi:IclR family transcriptional regulator, pca regulon regulatory protein